MVLRRWIRPGWGGARRAWRDGSADGLTQPAQALGVAEQLQPAPQNAAGQCLAHVGVAGQTLSGTVDGYPQVDLLILMTDETRAELLVQPCRHGLRKGPSQDRQVDNLRCPHPPP